MSLLAMLGGGLGGGIGSAGAGALGTLFVKLTADSTNLVRGVGQAETAVAGGTKRMAKQLGGLALAIGTVFAVIGVASVREFAKFDAAMTKSTAIMGDLDEGTRKAMESTARNMAKNGIQSAEQLADSYFFLASAGLSAKQSIAALPIVAAFATAGAFDMARATDLLTDAQSALGLTVKDTAKNMENMTRVSDVLVKANTLSNATVLQFSESLTNKAGAALRMVKKDVEEGAAVLAAFADQGVKGSEAGEKLNIVLRDLQRTSLAKRAEFEKLGISVFDAKGEMHSMADIVGDLEKALLPMSTAQKRATFELLGFQDRSLSAIAALLGMSDKIREYEKELRNAGGTTQEISEKQLQSFSNQLLMTVNRLKDIAITIGEGLAPALLQLNEMLGTLLNTNDSFNNSLKSSVGIIGQGLVYVIKAAVSIYQGWMGIIRMTGIALIAVAEAAVVAFEVVLGGIVSLVEGVVNNVIKQVNTAIRAVNTMVSLLPDWMGGGGKVIQEIEFKLTIDPVAVGDLKTLLSETKGVLIDDLVAMYSEAAVVIEDVTEDIADGAKEAAAAVKEAFDDIREEIDEVEAASARVKAVLDKMGEPATGISGKGMRGLSDPLVAQVLRIQEEVKITEENLEILKTLGEDEVAITAEVQKQKESLIAAYNDRLKSLQAAQTQIILSTSSKMFDDLAYISEQFAGRQSGIFKAMFAISKAFAIAEAIVKIQQGIAAAASQPWPLNLAAMASVISATAGIVSNIQAVKLEFGGARARGGPVSSGKSFLVGEEGPEMFVPSEDGTIIANDRLKGGSQPVKVVVNNFTDARPEINEREEGGEKIIEVVIRRIKNEIGSEIRDGGGSITKAMEQSFNLRRGQ